MSASVACINWSEWCWEREVRLFDSFFKTTSPLAIQFTSFMKIKVVLSLISVHVTRQPRYIKQCSHSSEQKKKAKITFLFNTSHVLSVSYMNSCSPCRAAYSTFGIIVRNPLSLSIHAYTTACVPRSTCSSLDCPHTLPIPPQNTRQTPKDQRPMPHMFKPYQPIYIPTQT